eukprot:CAMPEP_0176429456 /NCGR_PEP_ID=MMETSP0127-20121128/13721_1 /TAXON_ID=938130 /ORGANISM="Platyophrya macrostoma, Strain WH" /LENGTH=76 /DNA_ID=CAMNT_0017811263 /DNA_START=39 /DNA_END=269 /DNA_ORIENTATION=+
MEINIKGLEGDTWTIEVGSADLIEEVKLKVQEVSGKTPDEQRLIFAGRQMEDGKKLSDYNVSSGSTIHMVTRLKGN